MAVLKTAKLTVEAVTVWCPECGEAFDGTSDGSTIATREDQFTRGQVVHCLACDGDFKLPALVETIGVMK